MADFGPWNPFPAMQDYQINQQTIEDNKQKILSDKLDNQQKQSDAEIQQQAADYMSKISQGGSVTGAPDLDNAPKSMSAAFMQTAQRLMQLGAPKQAQQYLTAAENLDANERANLTTQTNIQKDNGDILIKQSDLIGRYLGGAHSQEAWDNGLKTLDESGAFSPGQLAKFRSIPFHESTTQVLRDQALSVSTQAQLANQAADNQRADNALASSQQHAQAAQALAQHRSDEADRIETLREKHGTAATAPSKETVDGVKAMVVSQIYKGQLPAGGKNDPALNAGAQTIAARAQAMTKEDPTLDWPTAVARAVTESEMEGDWVDQVNVKSVAGLEVSRDKTDPTFEPGGKNKRSPIALPPKGQPPRVGKFYQTSRGVAKWDGKQFIPVE